LPESYDQPVGVWYGNCSGFVEGELIDDFVDGELDDLETRAFLERLTATPAQRLKIRFVAGLKKVGRER
jgi:hypothetical protein